MGPFNLIHCTDPVSEPGYILLHQEFRLDHIQPVTDRVLAHHKSLDMLQSCFYLGTRKSIC